jgi:hypothetical protein
MGTPEACYPTIPVKRFFRSRKLRRKDSHDDAAHYHANSQP